MPLVRGIYSTLKSMMDILSFSDLGPTIASCSFSFQKTDIIALHL